MRGHGHGAEKSIPMPSRNVRTSRTVMERVAGTVSPSNGPRPSTRTLRPASSGSRSSTGSSSRSRHSSTRISAATALIGFVIDERRKIESRADRPPLAPGQRAGDADFDVTVARREPGETSGVSQLDVLGHGVVKATQPCLLESAHTPTYPTTDVLRRDRGRSGSVGALPAPRAARARPDGARVRSWR